MGPFNTETTITLTKKELLSLLFKLKRPESAKSLIRLGEDGKEYYIQALEGSAELDNWLLHPLEEIEYRKFKQFEGT